MFAGSLAAQQHVPELHSAVTDLTNSLTPAERNELEQTLRAFSARKGSQIAVLIVDTVQPEAIEQYAIRVASAWKLGRKGVDDGALLLVAKSDRQVRIEVGYGLEGALNDATCKRIIEEIIVPRFREGAFMAGITEGTRAMIKIVNGEELPPPAPTISEDARNNLTFLLFVAVAIGLAVRASVGTPAGVITAWVVAFAIGAFFIPRLLAFFYGAFAAFLTLGSGGGSGGYSGIGGSRSSSGGGFSGGGGSFGGGGASGRW